MEVPRIDPSLDVPAYEQVRVHIASRVASGELPPGTPLPTVRALAAQLQLATNTVARAYRELENDGVVLTEGRRGTSVAPSAAASGASSSHAADAYVAAVRRLGLSRAEAVRLVERAW